MTSTPTTTRRPRPKKRKTSGNRKRPVPKPKLFSQGSKLSFERHKEHEMLPGELPNPVPDTGYRPTQTQDAHSSAILTIHHAHLPTAANIDPSLVTFSALPPITTMDPPPLSTPVPDPILDQTLSAAASQPYPVSKTHGLSVPIIILLAALSLGLLGSLFFVLNYCYRPKRRPRPKPSLPILDDSFAEDKSDSPIFGGKERLSSRPGSTGLWAWTQYSSGSKKPQKADDISSGDQLHGYGAVSRSPRIQAGSPLPGRDSKTPFRFPGHSHTYSAPVLAADSPYQPSLKQVRCALSRATSRISAASMSLYPASPQVSNGDVGIAVASASPGTVFTGDGHDVLKRTDHRPSLERSRSNMSDAKTKHLHGTAYDGADVASPTFLPYVTSQVVPTTARSGRTRIKSSYYTPGAYPRVSHSSSMGKSGGFQQQKQPSMPEFEHQGSRVLTDALGLTSPESDPVPSYHAQTHTSNAAVATVVDGKRPGHQRKMPEKEGFPVIKTAVGATAALGSLVDLRTTQASQRLSTNNGSTSTPEMPIQGEPIKNLSRTTDKPPYIPLPAALPSLTQMAMEHTNPGFYADYRSPTYSIYGLYECERKKGEY